MSARWPVEAARQVRLAHCAHCGCGFWWTALPGLEAPQWCSLACVMRAGRRARRLQAIAEYEQWRQAQRDGVRAAESDYRLFEGE